MPRVAARTVLEALQSKHWEDIFFSECKTGPSYGSQGCPRMDGWVMNRTWSQQCFTGYEVKVDRSDFMNDDKWHTYLPYCNEFYFVCPTGLIKPDEVGQEAGLMYLSKTGTRLFRKKKAPHRQCDPAKLSQLLQYVIMWRMKLQVPRDTVEGKSEYWKRWMETKELNEDLGYSVGKAIQIRIKEEVTKAQNENKKLQVLVAKCDDVRDFLKQYNIDIKRAGIYNIKQKMTQVYESVPKHILGTLESTEMQLATCRKILTALRETSGNDVQV